MRKLWFAICLLLAVSVFAEDAVVDSKGTGTTRENAINAALLQAVQQKTGVNVAALMKSTQQATEESTYSTKKGYHEKRKNAGAEQLDVLKWATGYVSGYDIVSEGKDAATGLYAVEMKVRIPEKYVLGTDPDVRRRMVVGGFKSKANRFSYFGETFNVKDWTERFRNDLVVHLTQTRKFTMLDRDFDDAVNSELAKIASGNTRPGEIVKLGQKLGTDYLLVGTISFFDIRGAKNPITGAVMPESTLFAEVYYRVLLVATGQLKWSDTVKLDIRSMGNARGGDFLVASSEYAATVICDSIMSNILPMEVAAVLNDGTVIIGEGGKSLVEGEIFDVYALGDEITDSRTGEIIDVIEKPVGKIRITRVLPKLSHAVVIEGNAKDMTPGSRVRRTPMAVENAPQEPLPMTVRPTGNGGVVTPF